jgi:ubiquitin-protein ligase
MPMPDRREFRGSEGLATQEEEIRRPEQAHDLLSCMLQSAIPRMSPSVVILSIRAAYGGTKTITNLQKFSRDFHHRLIFYRMSTLNTRRLQKDISELVQSPPPDVSVSNTGESLTSISVTLNGSEATAYEGGSWRINLKIPPDYPVSPPKAYFVTKIFHPNVHPSTGEVCVDTLKRDWKPELTLNDILLVRKTLVGP